MKTKVASKSEGFFIRCLFSDVDLIEIGGCKLLNAKLNIVIPVATGEFSVRTDVLLLSQLKIGFPNRLSID